MKHASIIKNMTLDEKVSLLSGQDVWHTKAVERLGIRQLLMTDGPHGLRKHAENTVEVGIHESVPSTCFPPAVNLASSWDEALVADVARHIAIEAKAEGVDVVLGPGINIKRHPYNGRNFEYFSEDPFLTGQLATAFIKGMQDEGVGTSLKHFAANNQETKRMVIDTIVDERTLRELYLKGFEMAIKQARPWTVMCAYNRVNGAYMSENPSLLDDILRKEWGYDGVMVTDWGAVNDRVSGLKATLDLEMPASKGINDKAVADAIRAGNMDEQVLDQAVDRLLDLIHHAGAAVDHPAYDHDAHHAFARKAAADTFVLLRNEDDILPLDTNQKLAIIGDFANQPRYQGSGSSQINPTRLDHLATLVKTEYPNLDVIFARGYDANQSTVDERLIAEAVETAGQADVVIVLAGLTDVTEAEGFDRDTLSLSPGHDLLIERLSAVNQHVVVILSNGAPVAMPWLDKVKGVLECYLGGQAQAGALLDVLFGQTNPSGRLAETFPAAIEDVASHAFFPGHPRQVVYQEGLYVGYRYFSSAKVRPLFCFGYGLSYTHFGHHDLTVFRQDKTVKVTLIVSNDGKQAGKEVVQLYVAKTDPVAYQPAKALKAWRKIHLEPGERQTVSFVLEHDAFAYYEVETGRFEIEGGAYAIQIGRSVDDIVFASQIEIAGTHTPKPGPSRYMNIEQGFAPRAEDYEQLYGNPVPKPEKRRPYTRMSTLMDVNKTLIGKFIIRKIKHEMRKRIDSSKREVESKMIHELLSNLPLKTLTSFAGVSNHQVDGLIHLLNHRYRKAFKSFRKQKKTP